MAFIIAIYFINTWVIAKLMRLEECGGNGANKIYIQTNRGGADDSVRRSNIRASVTARKCRVSGSKNTA
jgi:hypothetical protein